MHDIDDELALGVIGEEILGQIKLVLDVVSAQPTRTEFNELKADVAELKGDIAVVKAAVTDVSIQLCDHATRLHGLEAITHTGNRIQSKRLRRKIA